MQAVLLLLLLAGTSKGLDSTCNATQDAACYGALGGPVYLQLIRDTTGYDLRLYNGHESVFKFRSSRPSPSLQRWQFVPDNGTLIINPAEMRDAGTYRVEIYEESTGKSVGEHTVQLIIKAPVSDLSISCSANGEKRVRCSSNGDSPQYSWSLDGRPLSETDADLSADNQTLLLSGNVTGELTCSVSNHVSSTNTSVLLLEVCSGTSTVSVTPTNQTNTTLPSTHPGHSVTGVGSICDATQDAVCYGALGGPVYLQLMRDTSGHTLSFRNEHETIFRFRASKTTFLKEINTPSFIQRWQFVHDNGTLIINPAEGRDAGTYTVKIHEESTGKGVGEHTVQLIIEAPVSHVDLSISSSANGEWRVRCSSNGDSSQYRWYLDGRPLSKADADLSPDNQTVLFSGNVTGGLTCSAWNHVSSRRNSALLLDACSGTHTTTVMELCSGISPVFISVWLAEIIILTSLLVGGYYLYIRNKRTHTPDECKDQEVELTPTSMSRRRRRTPEEVQMQ